MQLEQERRRVVPTVGLEGAFFRDLGLDEVELSEDCVRKLGEVLRHPIIEEVGKVDRLDGREEGRVQPSFESRLIDADVL